MLTKEDMQQLSDLMDQKLDPINKRLDKVDERLNKIDERLETVEERLGELEYKMEIVKGATNALSEWAEAASKFYTPKIHFPLNEDEKIS